MMLVERKKYLTTEPKCVVWRHQENGLSKLRKLSNTKKFIYLISPKSIVNSREFFKDLELVLKSKKIFFFQLRLKKENKKKIIYIGKKVKKICEKNKVNFIINDNPNVAKIIGADGCHLGQKDTSIIKAKKILKKKNYWNYMSQLKETSI